MKGLREHLIFLLVLSCMMLSSCKKDPIVDPNEGELITTVKLILTDLQMGSTATKEYIFQDLDGEGGVPPQKFDSIVLTKGKSYKCEIQLLNESTSPVDDITAEVMSEAVDHQVYILLKPVGATTITYGDKDSNNLPIGLISYWNVGNAAATGNVNITLKHKPGYKKLDDPVTLGDTDVSIDFKLRIQ